MTCATLAQVVELPEGSWGESEAAEASQTTTMRGVSFRPEYVQWSLRHRNLRRTSGVPLNNIFWCGFRTGSSSCAPIRSERAAT